MSGLYSPILEQAGFIKRKGIDLVKRWYDPVTFQIYENKQIHEREQINED